MAIKKPIPISFGLDSHNSVQSVCAVIHIDDNNTETLDLSLMQGGEHIAVSQNSTVTARFVRVKDKILISDNVPCAVQENGNILIPIDNAAAHMLVGEIKIEVNIVDENDVLTMQFPLVIRVNNTILADAEISPESEGTIPELLEEAREAAEDAVQAAEAATEAISTKQDKLTAGENITIENNVISAEGGGVTSYDDLTDKPNIRAYKIDEDVTTNFQLSGSLTFEYPDFKVYGTTGDLSIILDKRVFKSLTHSMIGYIYNFNWFSSDYAISGVFLQNLTLTQNAPNPLNDLSGNQYFVFHYFQPFNGFVGKTTALLRQIHFKDTSGNNKIYSQIASATKKANGSYVISNQSDWVELTGGGSQIVSGVVNANGTITFTDSDGNTFTTSGSSVIGADGFSPSATVQQTASGATITVTDKNGTTTANITNGQDGNDYVLTAQDKDDIADIVLSELPTTEGVLYGNQSN